MAKFKYNWNRIFPLVCLLFVFIFVFNANWSPVRISHRRRGGRSEIEVSTILSDKDKEKVESTGNGGMMDLGKDQDRSKTEVSTIHSGKHRGKGESTGNGEKMDLVKDQNSYRIEVKTIHSDKDRGKGESNGNGEKMNTVKDQNSSLIKVRTIHSDRDRENGESNGNEEKMDPLENQNRSQIEVSTIPSDKDRGKGESNGNEENMDSLENQDSPTIKVRTIHSDKDRAKGESDGNGGMMDLLKDQKCNIPKLDINGSEVSSFFHDSAPLDCQIPGRFEKEWIFLDDQGVIRFSEEHQKAICQMQYFWRITEHLNRYGKMISVEDGDKFDGGEYAKVNCHEKNTTWTTLFWNITPNLKAMERAKKLRDAEKKKYNVYILGFDSLSQMSFRRKLPQTVKFLEETLGSVVLNGYNIVGDGTPQALIPILTAQTETELPLTRKRFNEARYLDDVYPMI